MKRRTIVINDGYLLLATMILNDNARLIVKNNRGGIAFKSNLWWKKGGKSGKEIVEC